MIRKNLYISDTQDLELKKLSDISGLKMSELIRRAIDDFIEKMTKKDTYEK